MSVERQQSRVGLLCIAAVLAGCSKAGDAPVDSSRGAAKSGDTSRQVLSPSERPRTISFTPDQRARLRILTVAAVPFRPAVSTTGTVAFDQDVSTQVLAPISGPVTRVIAKPGTYVRPGEPLATVSSPDYATAVAGYRKAEATAVQTKRVADLDEQLWKNDAIARRDLEQAQLDAVAASADRDAALQQLRALGVQESTIEALRSNRPTGQVEGAIRSPIAGTVVEQLINPGQLLQAGTTPTFTVADLSTVWVMANVFESDLPLVTKGETATVTMSGAAAPFTGRVDYVSALVDPATKATAVRVVVSNTNRLLKKDMYVNVVIQSNKMQQGLLLPVSAVLRDEDNLPFVYVENADSTFARRQITLGARVGDRFEIKAGIAPGDKVIAEGGLFVQFAQSQ